MFGVLVPPVVALCASARLRGVVVCSVVRAIVPMYECKGVSVGCLLRELACFSKS